MFRFQMQYNRELSSFENKLRRKRRSLQTLSSSSAINVAIRPFILTDLGVESSYNS